MLRPHIFFMICCLYGLNYISKASPVASCVQNCQHSDFRCVQSCNQQISCQCQNINCNNCGMCCSKCCQSQQVIIQQNECNNCGSCASSGNCQPCCNQQNLCECRNVQCSGVQDPYNNCQQSCCQGRYPPYNPYHPTNTPPPPINPPPTQPPPTQQPPATQPPGTYPPRTNPPGPYPPGPYQPGPYPPGPYQPGPYPHPPYPNPIYPHPPYPPQNVTPSILSPNPIIINTPQLPPVYFNVQINSPPPPNPDPKPPQEVLRLPNFTFNIRQPAITLTIPINNTIKCNDGDKNSTCRSQTPIFPTFPSPPLPTYPYQPPCTPTSPGVGPTVINGTTVYPQPCTPTISPQLPCCSVMHGGGCSGAGSVLYPFQQMCQPPQPIQYCGTMCSQAFNCQVRSGGQPCYMPTFPTIQGGGCATNTCVQDQLSIYGSSAVNSAVSMLCIQIAGPPFAHCVPVNGGQIGANPHPIKSAQGQYILG